MGDREYDVTVVVTHEGRIKARSRQDAIDAAIADSGRGLTDQTDITCDATVVPR